MSTEQIILYDIPSQQPNKPWSPNTWKTRLLLNFKGLDYKTEWIEYPDIEQTLKGHVEPQKPGTAMKPYTLPAVRFPDGTYVMDSAKIRQAVEERYPSTTPATALLPDADARGPSPAAVQDLARQVFKAALGILMPSCPRTILNPRSAAYWYETRRDFLGMPIEEFEKLGLADKATWDGAAPALKEITRLLKGDEGGEGGPFFAGRTKVAYVDLLWAAFLLYFKSFGEEWFKGPLEASGDGEVHLRLLEAVKVWCEKTD